MRKRKKHTDKDERPVVVEVWVCKKRCKEVLREGPGKSDIRVMAVVCCIHG